MLQRAPIIEVLRSSTVTAAVAAAGVVFACAFAALPQHLRAQPADSPLVYRVPVTGVIELGLAPFIERSLREASAAGARAVILEIETPGGRIDAAQRVANAISDADVPVYAYVNHRALSAGAMIALATRGVFMRTGSILGAATPVTGEGQTAPEKIVSAMRSEMRALAEAGDLDPRVAEAMVDPDVEIPGVVEEGKLLTLTTDEAEALGYAREVSGYDDLLAELGIQGATTVETQVNWAEGLVRFLTHPTLTPLLLSIGFLGLLIEIKSPSFGIAGIAGAFSLALFFGSHYLVGLAGMEEVIILVAGLILLAIEIFVVPGFGIFGIGGILAVLASIYMSMIGQFATIADYGQAAGVLSATALIVLVSAWALTRVLPKSGRLTRSGIFLGESTSRETGYLSASTRPDLLGVDGVAITALRPAGAGRFGTERIDVVAEDGWIEAGRPIRIVRTEGYRNVVIPVSETAESG